MATRASVLNMARLYSQVPTTMVGDTQAYLLLDDEDRSLWNEVAATNPMLITSFADINYPVGQSYYDITSPAAILRLVMIGRKDANTSPRYIFDYPLRYLEFVELEQRLIVERTGTIPYGFFWTGQRLFMRPIPQEEVTLRIGYVPPITLGTGAGGTVLGNVTYLQQFTDVLAMRLAIRLCDVCGRSSGNWPSVLAEREKQMMVQVEKTQDVEPRHVAMTDAYREGALSSGVATEY